MLTLPALAAVTLSLSDGSGADIRYVPERHGTALDLSTSPAANLSLTSRTSAFDAAIVYGSRSSTSLARSDFGAQHLASMAYSWGYDGSSSGWR